MGLAPMRNPFPQPWTEFRRPLSQRFLLCLIHHVTTGIGHADCFSSDPMHRATVRF
jgi:hypothetical protein